MLGGDRRSLWRLSIAAAATLSAIACSKMGDRPPWWPEQRPIGPELLCEQKPQPASSAPPVRDPSAIQAVVRSKDAAFGVCYDNVRQRNPEATGQMWTRFVIDKHGKVTSACLERADIDDHDGGECLLEAFRELRFPSVSSDQTVVYPLRFVPGSSTEALMSGPPAPRGRDPTLKRFVVHPKQ